MAHQRVGQGQGPGCDFFFIENDDIGRRGRGQIGSGDDEQRGRDELPEPA